jgi:hypothetical protein
MIPRHLIFGTAAMLVIAVGAGIYAWHLRRQISRQPAPTEISHPASPPPQGPMEQVTLWIAEDDPGTLRPRAATIPMPSGRQERAEELMRALLNVYTQDSSPHPIVPTAEVRTVFLVDPGLAVIDLNRAFAEGHRSGILVEELTIASMVETITANIPGTTRVKFLIDGKSQPTLAGHAELSISYDVSAVQQLAAALQNMP